MTRRPAMVAALLALARGGVGPAVAHDGPVRLPPPQSVAEAWNVVRLSAANVDQLLAENLARDVAAQLANIALALPALRTNAARAAVVDRLTGGLVAVLDASRGDDARRRARAAWDPWRQTLADLQRLYPAEVVNAEIYICPMHPDDRHTNAADECSVCGMALVRRRLPASAVYQKPGEPTLRLTLVAPPLEVGRRADVLLRLAKPDGRPVTPADLLEAHTKKIHLLINDASLTDYHHEHPAPTAVAGEYAFSFTPAKPGPYRVWADVVPADSGVQEYDAADLPATAAPLPLTDGPTATRTTVDGLTFELSFDTAGRSPRAGETTPGTVTVTGPDGAGFTRLEPVMGAFAHLVGFGADGHTVLHVHPYGKTPAGPGDRAGPAFAFKLYPPGPGLLRLYCQVQVDGRQVFAPFTLHVDRPAAPPPSRPADTPPGGGAESP